jgi:hypothetical protein
VGDVDQAFIAMGIGGELMYFDVRQRADDVQEVVLQSEAEVTCPFASSEV